MGQAALFQQPRDGGAEEGIERGQQQTDHGVGSEDPAQLAQQGNKKQPGAGWRLGWGGAARCGSLVVHGAAFTP
jgi:hypothetical protein